MTSNIRQQAARESENLTSSAQGHIHSFPKSTKLNPKAVGLNLLGLRNECWIKLLGLKKKSWINVVTKKKKKVLD